MRHPVEWNLLGRPGIMRKSLQGSPNRRAPGWAFSDIHVPRVARKEIDSGSNWPPPPSPPLSPSINRPSALLLCRPAHNHCRHARASNVRLHLFIAPSQSRDEERVEAEFDLEWERSPHSLIRLMDDLMCGRARARSSVSPLCSGRPTKVSLPPSLKAR